MKEADIVRAILRYLKTVPNCFCWKEHGGMYGTAGIPDVIACIGGRFFAFEVKTEEGKATALQESVLRKIQKCGGGFPPPPHCRKVSPTRQSRGISAFRSFG